ncbi:MAG: histone deacetylase family protein, partial [Pseudomonadota bacterium]
LARIASFGAEALVISLGVDTFKDDPISFFRLESEHFTRMGARIAAAGLPTLFVMEGGYAVAEVGINTVNVLTGFEGA